MTNQREAALRARREAVLQLWRKGRSASVIATMLGLTVCTVRNDVHRSRKANPDGAPRRRRCRRPLTTEERAEIQLLKAEGRSQAAIARALILDHHTVARALRKATSDPIPAIGVIGTKIVAMCEAGSTGRAIANRFGLASMNNVYATIGSMAPERKPKQERRGPEQSLREQVAALRRQKRSYREIARELGITQDMVGYYVQCGLASGAIARRVPIVKDAQAQEIIALNASGSISSREIARRLNVTQHTVLRILRIAGVAPGVVERRQQLKSRILALWEAGRKTDAIAHACGTTVKNVWATAYRAARKNPALRRQAPPLSAAEIHRIAALRREV